MKTRNLFTATAIFCAATVFTACSVNDKGNEPANDPVRFAAGIDKQTANQTRAAESVWAAGDEIGIFMTDGATTHYANSQYTTSGDGTFTAVAGDEMYYPMDGSAVGFTAYYPYLNGATLGTAIDVTIASPQTTVNQPSFDLLYASGVTGSKANGTTPVALTFAHKLAKLVMNTSANTTVGAPLADMTVSIKGMNTMNTFNLSTGTLGTASIPAAIIPRTVTDGSVYDAIIMPGTYSAGIVSVEFTLADGSGDIFTWNLGAVEFVGGNEYEYNVELARTGVVVTGSITPWTTTNRGGVTAD